VEHSRSPFHGQPPFVTSFGVEELSSRGKARHSRMTAPIVASFLRSRLPSDPCTFPRRTDGLRFWSLLPQVSHRNAGTCLFRSPQSTLMKCFLETMMQCRPPVSFRHFVYATLKAISFFNTVVTVAPRRSGWVSEVSTFLFPQFLQANSSCGSRSPSRVSLFSSQCQRRLHVGG